MEKENSPSALVGIQLDIATEEKGIEVSQNFKIDLTCNSATPLLGIFLEKLKH